MYKNDYPNLAVLQLFELTEGECGKGVLPDTTFRFFGKIVLSRFQTLGREMRIRHRGEGGGGRRVDENRSVWICDETLSRTSQSKLKLRENWSLFPQASEDSQNYEVEGEKERATQEHERAMEGPDRVTVEMMDSTDVPIERSVIRQQYKSLYSIIHIPHESTAQ